MFMFVNASATTLGCSSCQYLDNLFADDCRGCNSLLTMLHYAILVCYDTATRNTANIHVIALAQCVFDGLALW